MQIISILNYQWCKPLLLMGPRWLTSFFSKLLCSLCHFLIIPGNAFFKVAQLVGCNILVLCMFTNMLILQFPRLTCCCNLGLIYRLQYGIPSNDLRCQLCCSFKLAHCHRYHLMCACRLCSKLFGKYGKSKFGNLISGQWTFVVHFQ